MTRRPGFLAPFAALFLFGAVVVPIFDGFHTHSGTTEYTSPVVWQMAWWVPLLFGSSVAIGGLVYARAWDALRGPKRFAAWWRLGVAFAAFASSYYASAYWDASSEVKLAVFAAVAAGNWGLVDRTWQGVVLAAVTAVLGCTTEITLIHLGTFRYPASHGLGIPLWLPALYLVSGPALGQMARRVLAVP